MTMTSTRKIATVLLAGAASLALVTGASLAQTGTTGGTGTTGQSGTGTGTGTGTAVTTEQSAGMLEEDDVKSLLEDHGYSDVEDLEQSGMAWIGNATRDDEDVELRIERLMQSASALDEDGSEMALEMQGFTEISDIEEDDDVWTADAEYLGDSVKVYIDAEEEVVVSEKSSG